MFLSIQEHDKESGKPPVQTKEAFRAALVSQYGCLAREGLPSSLFNPNVLTYLGPAGALADGIPGL